MGGVVCCLLVGRESDSFRFREFRGGEIAFVAGDSGLESVEESLDEIGGASVIIESRSAFTAITVVTVSTSTACNDAVMRYSQLLGLGVASLSLFSEGAGELDLSLYSLSDEEVSLSELFASFSCSGNREDRILPFTMPPLPFVGVGLSESECMSSAPPLAISLDPPPPPPPPPFCISLASLSDSMSEVTGKLAQTPSNIQ